MLFWILGPPFTPKTPWNFSFYKSWGGKSQHGTGLYSLASEEEKMLLQFFLIRSNKETQTESFLLVKACSQRIQLFVQHNYISFIVINDLAFLTNSKLACWNTIHKWWLTIKGLWTKKLMQKLDKKNRCKVAQLYKSCEQKINLHSFPLFHQTPRSNDLHTVLAGIR